MKKMRFFVLAVMAVVLGLVLVAGCATPMPQIKKGKEPIPKMDVLTFGEIKVWKMSSGELKNDEDAQKLIASFRQSFLEELAKRDIKVRDGDFASVRVDMTYKVIFGIPLPHRILTVKVLILSGGKPILEVEHGVMYGWLPPIDYAIPKMASWLAEPIAKQLKGE